MTTKLTLTIDESIIDSAKAYARDQGRSLSDVVENYLKVLLIRTVNFMKKLIQLGLNIKIYGGLWDKDPNFIFLISKKLHIFYRLYQFLTCKFSFTITHLT